MIKQQAEVFFIKVCFVLFIAACIFAVYYYRQYHSGNSTGSINQQNIDKVSYEKP